MAATGPRVNRWISPRPGGPSIPLVPTTPNHVEEHWELTRLTPAIADEDLTMAASAEAFNFALLRGAVLVRSWVADLGRLLAIVRVSRANALFPSAYVDFTTAVMSMSIAPHELAEAMQSVADLGRVELNLDHLYCELPIHPIFGPLAQALKGYPTTEREVVLREHRWLYGSFADVEVLRLGTPLAGLE